jgi:hypothetical protein
MRWLYGFTGYFYIIMITKPDNSIFYMNVREGTALNNIYEKLEDIRQNTPKKRFTFTKTSVPISTGVNALHIIIPTLNDIVVLNP